MANNIRPRDVRHFARAIEAIAEYLKIIKTKISPLGEAGLRADPVYLAAAVKMLENIAEELKRLAPLIDADSNIHIRGWRGLRNLTSHEYHLADTRAVWRQMEDQLPKVEAYLPTLRQKIAALRRANGLENDKNGR